MITVLAILYGLGYTTMIVSLYTAYRLQDDDSNF